MPRGRIVTRGDFGFVTNSVGGVGTASQVGNLANNVVMAGNDEASAFAFQRMLDRKPRAATITAEGQIGWGETVAQMEAVPELECRKVKSTDRSGRDGEPSTCLPRTTKGPPTTAGLVMQDTLKGELSLLRPTRANFRFATLKDGKVIHIVELCPSAKRRNKMAAANRRGRPIRLRGARRIREGKAGLLHGEVGQATTDVVNILVAEKGREEVVADGRLDGGEGRTNVGSYPLKILPLGL